MKNHICVEFQFGETFKPGKRGKQGIDQRGKTYKSKKFPILY